jgi:hydrogenase maturation protease
MQTRGELRTGGMLMENGSIVVVGIGNILLGDEGIGVHLTRILQKEFVHSRVSYYDGGTKGLTLLPFLEEASHLLILDAVRAEGASGTIVEMSDHELMGNSLLKFSAHDIALPDLLALLRFKRGPGIQIRFLGVVPGSFDYSTDLSPEVKNSLSDLRQRAKRILSGWIRQMEEESRLNVIHPGCGRDLCV